MQEAKDILAFLGGKPAFDHKIHVGRPNIGDRARLLERINTMLDAHWLSNGGPFVREFEHRVASIVGVKHCIAMCNATVALEIAIRALDLKGRSSFHPLPSSQRRMRCSGSKLRPSL
jgi:hypothetical protein